MLYLFHSFTQSGKAIQQWLKSLFGLRLPLLLSLLVLTGMVSSCSKIPLGLMGGGANVAANTQVGKTNNQTVGTTQNTEQKITQATAQKISQSTESNDVKTDSVENININNLPMWFVIFFMLWSLFLWELPAPRHIGQWFRNLFKR